MNMNKKAIIIGSTAVTGITLLGAFSYGITKKLVQIALDREAPSGIEKAKAKISSVPDFKDFFDYMDNADIKLQNSDTKHIEIIGHDGIRLVGHWKPCEKPERIIIAMHGWRSTWSHDFGTATEFWESNNCCVLYPEQRGQNNSGGDYMGFGMLERYDCLEWIKWVNKYTDKKLPVYLFGVSMGATTVLMSAELDLPENVHGIVADCGFTSPEAIWKHVAKKNLRLPYGIRGRVANGMCKKRINLGLNDFSAVEAMKKCKVPVLFIHGTDDHFVPVEMTYENYKACASPRHLFIVPGADHGMSYYTDKKGYEKVLAGFWEQYDKKSLK